MISRSAVFIAVLYLLSCPHFAVAQTIHLSENYNTWRRVISPDQLTAAGISRLSDLFTLLPDWRTTSIEEYTWNASANGLSPYQRPSWQILVDEIPLDLYAAGTSNINALPLTVLQIDSVEVINIPAIISGRFAEAGIIHIHTKKPKEGIHVSGGVAAGNETGDPGPYSFTEWATPNKDRIGPSYSALLAFSRSNTSLQLGFRSDQHHLTNQQIRPRVYSLYQGIYNPRLLISAPNLVLKTEGKTSRHTFTAGRSRFQNLLFFAPVGREIPARQTFSHLGLAGTLALGKSNSLRYHVSYNSNELNERPNRRDYDFDWRQDRLFVNTEMQVKSPLLTAALGSGVDYTYVFSPTPLADPSLLLTSAYGLVHTTLTPFWKQYAAVHLTHAFDRIGVKGLTRMTVYPTNRQSLTVNVSYARFSPEERDDLWFWVDKGYRFPGQDEVALTLPSFHLMSNAFTIDAGWSFQSAGSFNLNFSTLYRSFLHHALTTYDFHFDSGTIEGSGSNVEFFVPETSVHPDVTGQVIGLSAGVSQSILRSIHHNLTYSYLRPYSSDVVFWRAWSCLPWHLVQYSFLFTHDARFSIYGRLYYQSPTKWPDFAPASLQSNGKFPERLPHLLLTDMTVHKRFWHDHISASFSISNALNRNTRYHPAGAITSLAFHARLVLNLGMSM